MSTSGLILRRPASRRFLPTAVLASGGVAAAVFVGAVGFQSRHAFLHEAVPVLLVPLAAWLFFSEREELTLAVLLIYLGLFDGVLKLSSGSSIATLGRDVLLYSIALGALARMALRQQPISIPPLGGLVLAWVAVCVMQIANPSNVSTTHAVVSLRQDLEFVPLFFLGYVVLRSEHRVTGLLLLLVCVAALNGVVSLIQVNLTPSQLASWGPGYATFEFGSSGHAGVIGEAARVFVNSAGVSKVRPFGLGGEDGFGGILGLIALPGAVVLMSSLRRTVKLAWLLIPATALTLVAIVTSQTRLAVVGSVIALLAYGALTVTSRRGVLALLVTVAVGWGGFYAVSGFVSTTSNRYSSIAPSKLLGTTFSSRQGTMTLVPQYLASYPLGAGLGSVGPGAGSAIGGNAAARGLNGESQLTFLLIETGIPGLLVMLAFSLATLRVGFMLRRVVDVRLQRSLMALTAVLVSLLAVWIFAPVTADSPTSPFIWLSAGCLAYWYEEMRSGRVEMRPRRMSRALALR